MVATKGSDAELVAGQRTIATDSFTNDTWVLVITNILSQLRMEYLRGFKRPDELLTRESHTTLQPRQVIHRYDISSLKEKIGVRTVFLECLCIKDVPYWNDWPTEQRTVTGMKIPETVDVPYVSQHLFLSRKKKFFLGEVTWVRTYLRRSSGGIRPVPMSECWYGSTDLSMRLIDLKDALDMAVSVNTHKKSPGVRILRALAEAQENTASVLKNQYEDAARTAAVLKERLRLIDEFV